MPTQLSRLVFRQLLANEPIAHPGCLRHSLRPRIPRPHRALSRPQRRLMFNLFGQPRREAVEPNLDPGLEKLMEYAKMERLKARLPPPEEVKSALKLFFRTKHTKKQPVEDIHAQYAMQALTYLRTQHPTQLDHSIGYHILEALLIPPHQPSSSHRDLAISAHEISTVSTETWMDNNKKLKDSFRKLVRILAATGYPNKARDYLISSRQEFRLRGIIKNQTLWSSIMQAFKNQRDGLELDRCISIMEEYKIPPWAGLIGIMIEYSILVGDLHAAKGWYERITHPDLAPTERSAQSQDMETMQEVLLHHCLRTSELDFGQMVVRDMAKDTLSKFQWDLIFEWAAGTGKGVDEIERMMGIMEKANQTLEESKRRHPDIDTINRLVARAIVRKDPYMAERFIALGRKRQIEPNARTLVLQMDYRLSVNDVDGALVAYKHLQAQDLSDDQDVPAVNRLICAMCAVGRQDFDSIMNVAADLSERHARFEPATVSALSILHLSRGEVHDVIDLLNTHVFGFSASERALVRDRFHKYMTNKTTTTSKAWDAYGVFKQVFDEAHRKQRTLLMNDFFRRGRADMAVHVFNHMRVHTRADTIPTVGTYVACFQGIGRLSDVESLEVVHNLMKLDHSVEPNTFLLNALMSAFTACGLPRRALTFWDEIVSSREGPTMNSIHLAFRACEVSPWGDEKAREIWARLVRTGIELDQTLWASYAAGLVGNGDVQNTVGVLEEAHAARKVEMDTFIIGSVFNAAPGEAKQAEVESWATTHYPAIWKQLEAIGVRTANNRRRYFDIDRHVDP